MPRRNLEKPEQYWHPESFAWLEGALAREWSERGEPGAPARKAAAGAGSAAPIPLVPRPLLASAA